MLDVVFRGAPRDEQALRYLRIRATVGHKAQHFDLPTPDEAGHGPTPAGLAAVADQLERVIADGEPQKAKALLRLLIEELSVNGRTQIQPTYRLVMPEVCATSEKWSVPGSNRRPPACKGASHSLIVPASQVFSSRRPAD
jgi:hypothetical protein